MGTLEDIKIIENTLGVDVVAGSTIQGTITIGKNSKIQDLQVEDIAPQKHKPKRKESTLEHKKQLGEGGMGQIFSVRQKTLERDVALKELKQHLADDQHRINFLEEAILTGNLEHPNIPPTYHLDRTTCRWTMKKIKGKDLEEILNKGKKTTKEIIRSLLPVCDALTYAHSKGVIHRDIKPENIMVGEQGEVYLMDWGIAQINEKKSQPEVLKKISARRGDQEGMLSGTPKYLAPEQALGKSSVMDETTDVYAFGSMLYRIMQGDTPILAESIPALLFKKINPDTEIETPEGDKDLAAITMKCIAYEQEDRYPNAKELKKDLQRWLEGDKVSARKYGPVESLSKWAQKNPGKMLAALGISAGLLLSGAGLVWGINASAAKAKAEAAKVFADARAKKAAEERAEEAEKRAETEAKRADLAERLKNINEKQRRALELNLEGVSIERQAELVKTLTAKKQKLEDALDKYNAALASYQDLALAHNNRGNVHRKLGHAEQAIEDFDKAIELDPELALAYNNRALVNAARGKLDSAKKDFTEAIERLPLYTEAYVGRSVVHIRQGHYQDAIADCEKALEIKPKDTLAHWNKGESHMYLGEYRAAEASFRNAVTWGDVSARLMIARNMLNAAEAGRPLYENWRERAREQIETAISTDESLAKEAQELLEKIE